MNQLRQELLQELAKLSELFPDWRFGQLVANVANSAQGPKAEAVWGSEDEELLVAARRLIECNLTRSTVAQEQG